MAVVRQPQICSAYPYKKKLHLTVWAYSLGPTFLISNLALIGGAEFYTHSLGLCYG